MPPIRTAAQRRRTRVAAPPLVEDTSTFDSDYASTPSGEAEVEASSSARKEKQSFKGKLDGFSYSPTKGPKEGLRKPENLVGKWGRGASSAAQKRLALIEKGDTEASVRGTDLSQMGISRDMSIASASPLDSPRITRSRASMSRSPSAQPSASTAAPRRRTTLKTQSTLSLSPLKPQMTLSRTISTVSASPRAKVGKRAPKGYVPPERYAHLNLLPDVMDYNLISVFVGLNPGIMTAQMGHAYSHPSNWFWKLLYSSGLTPLRRLAPEEDQTLPSLYSLGNTNIVARPTKDQSELKKHELDDAVHILDAKVAKYKPESVCIVGKSIWESIFRVTHGRNMRKGEFDYGWQKGEKMGRGVPGYGGARIFVATTTSGSAGSVPVSQKYAVWQIIGDWVQERRLARGDVVGTPRVARQAEVHSEVMDGVMEEIKDEVMEEAKALVTEVKSEEMEVKTEVL